MAVRHGLLERLRQDYQELGATIRTLERYEQPHRQAAADANAKVALAQHSNGNSQKINGVPSLAGQPTREAIPIVLHAANKPLKPAGIKELLTAGGFTGSLTGISTMLHHLKQNRVVRKTKRGWRLA